MNKIISIVKTRISREIVLSSSVVFATATKSSKAHYLFETSVNSSNPAFPPHHLIWGCSSCTYKSAFLYRFTKWMHNRMAIHLFECVKKPPEFRPVKIPRGKRKLPKLLPRSGSGIVEISKS